VDRTSTEILIGGPTLKLIVCVAVFFSGSMPMTRWQAHEDRVAQLKTDRMIRDQVRVTFEARGPEEISSGEEFVIPESSDSEKEQELEESDEKEGKKKRGPKKKIYSDAKIRTLLLNSIKVDERTGLISWKHPAPAPHVLKIIMVCDDVQKERQ